MKKLLFCGLLLLGVIGIAYGGSTSRFELNDGSVFEAEIISFNNGVYTLKTRSIGEIKVDALSVRKIETLPSNTQLKSQMDSIKTAINSDPEATSMVTGLATDPQFQALIKDPDIVKAANSGNIQALISNKKFMDAVNNPKLEEIKNKLKTKGN